MAQCHAEGHRCPSAMDFYVGAFHSKFCSSNRLTIKYPHLHNKSAQSVPEDPTPASRSIPYGTHFVPSIPPNEGVKPSCSSFAGKVESGGRTSSGGSGTTKIISSSVHTSSLSCHGNDKKMPDLAGGVGSPPSSFSHHEAEVKPQLPSSHSYDITNVTSSGNLSALTHSSDADARINLRRSTSVKRDGGNTHANTMPRMYKSAELGVASKAKGNSDTSKCNAGRKQVAMNSTTSSTREGLNGGLIIGSQTRKVVASLSADSSGSLRADKEDGRWLPGGTGGNVLGGSPNGDDGSQKSLGSCDGAVAKHVPKGSAIAGSKPCSKSPHSIGTVRGMGNILVGSKVQGMLEKQKSSSKDGIDHKAGNYPKKKPDDALKPGDHLTSGFDLLDPEGIKNAGNEHYKLGHFSEAVALYDKSIALCPNHGPYRSNKAAALTGLGRLGEAVHECEEAIKLDPGYARAHHRAGHLYMRLGLIESAKRHFQAALLEDQASEIKVLQTIEKLMSRCIEARQRGDWKTVLRESNAIIDAGADSAPQVLGYKSEALLKLHRPLEAEASCAGAQKKASSLYKLGLASADSFLLILRVHIEVYLGRFEDATRVAELAVKMEPCNPQAVGLLMQVQAVARARSSGNDLFKSGRFFEACAAYGEGLESDPANAVLLCNRAACRSKLGQWEKAIEDCDAALGTQPRYVKALMRRAHCSTKLERWEDALRDYEVLRIEMPGDTEVARGYFDAQVALKKSRGEEVHKMKFGGHVEEIFDQEQFRDVVTSPGLSVVEFIARWSGRCSQISPFIDKLSKQFPCVYFVKVDVEENPHVAQIETVTFVPTFKIFKNGQKVKELLGPTEQALEHAVKHYGY